MALVYVSLAWTTQPAVSVINHSMIGCLPSCAAAVPTACISRAGGPTQAASFKTSGGGGGEEASVVQHGDFNKLLVAIQPRWVLQSSHRCFTTPLMEVSVHEDERVS